MHARSARPESSLLRLEGKRMSHKFSKVSGIRLRGSSISFISGSGITNLSQGFREVHDGSSSEDPNMPGVWEVYWTEFSNTAPLHMIWGCDFWV